jgi:hypothetical protein
MIKNHLFHSVLVAAGVLLIAACASEPRGSLLEKKFQRAAQHYEKFQHDGQTVYCRKEVQVQCLTEAQLRNQVERYERTRNTVNGPPIPAGAGQGSVGG